ncbi:hypothetical protein DFH06DRAFT_1474672 [Mycena polygramma]|nr:hypothetical protein DFH06DRAFT_1474672 [Mycena polygramma]
MTRSAWEGEGLVVSGHPTYSSSFFVTIFFSFPPPFVVLSCHVVYSTLTLVQ